MFHQNKPFLQIFFFWVLKNDFMNFFFFLHIFAGLGAALCATSPLQLPKQPFLPSSFLKVYKWTFVVVLGPCSLVA